MSEVYTGEIRDGVVIFEGPAPTLPAGTRVRIEPIEPEEEVQDLSRRLRSVAGMAKGLPRDLAAQHDHYAHGAPKR